jgi:uncharacterized DUF497 family protein
MPNPYLFVTREPWKGGRVPIIGIFGHYRRCFGRPICNTVRIYSVRYEWDQAKNLVFEEEGCLAVPDRVDRVTGEQRWHAIGAVRNESGTVAVLLVVHVYREEHNGEEIIRIISARAAEKRELRRYQEQTID